jgi:hypothetical protein
MTSCWPLSNVRIASSRSRPFESKTQHELHGRDVVVWLAGVRPVLGGAEDVEFADAVLEGRRGDLHAT